MTDRALVVADDLTGATDTGHGFAARGYETVVRLNPDFDAPDAAVLVVDTDSRYATPDRAAERVRDAVASTDAAVVFKKVDSTLRGNLGPEIIAALDAMDAATAAVAPAFPSNDRVTTCGYHLVEGALVTDTEAGTDPDAPVTRPRLPDYLRDQGVRDVTHIGVERVARGSSAVEGALAAGGVISFDAVHDAHLDAIGHAAANAAPHATDGPVLLVGSGGLAEHTRLPQDPTPERPTRHDSPTGTAFGVAGSVSARTRTQLDALSDSRIADIDASRAVTDVDGAAFDAAADCVERLESEPAVVLASAREEDAVNAVLSAAAAAGVDERVARERVTAALAVASRIVWMEAAPDGLFLTGGAVAKAVLGRLDAGGVALRGESVAPGVPVSTVRGGLAGGTPLVTKAGAFGDDTTIVDAFRVLRHVPSRRNS